MTRDAYRARTIKRFRRTRSQVDALDDQIVAVLTEDHPQSVRHVYYRMTDPRLPAPVEKTDKGYRDVQTRCLKLRRNGRIPYHWITDATRSGYFVNTFTSAGDFVRRMAGQYRADLWAQADVRCEVWVESRSIAGVILDTCQDLAVSLYPAGGFSSASFAYDAAQQINREDDGRTLVVLYVGDHDPAGVLIDRKIEEELRRHLEPGVVMHFERIGITTEQVETYGLPKKPRKVTDKRSPEVTYTVEAEAMPAHILRTLLRNRIEAMLPANALRVAKVAEASERDGLRRLASILEGGGLNG